MPLPPENSAEPGPKLAFLRQVDTAHKITNLASFGSDFLFTTSAGIAYMHSNAADMAFPVLSLPGAEPMSSLQVLEAEGIALVGGWRGSLFYLLLPSSSHGPPSLPGGEKENTLHSGLTCASTCCSFRLESSLSAGKHNTSRYAVPLSLDAQPIKQTFFFEGLLLVSTTKSVYLCAPCGAVLSSLFLGTFIHCFIPLFTPHGPAGTAKESLRTLVAISGFTVYFFAVHNNTLSNVASHNIQEFAGDNRTFLKVLPLPQAGDGRLSFLASTLGGTIAQIDLDLDERAVLKYAVVHSAKESKMREHLLPGLPSEGVHLWIRDFVLLDRETLLYVIDNFVVHLSLRTKAVFPLAANSITSSLIKLALFGEKVVVADVNKKLFFFRLCTPSPSPKRLLPVPAASLPDAQPAERQACDIFADLEREIDEGLL